MADQPESPKESLMDKISAKIHDHLSSSSSSSDSESEKAETKPESQSSVKAKIYRLFGRERPVHSVLGGGKPADLLLWSNKKISAGVLGAATAIWILFELIEYHLLTLVCHSLIVALAVLFLWSNAHVFIHKTPPHIPEVSIPEEPILQVAAALRMEINRGFAVLHNIAAGKDSKKFLIVIAVFWILSVFGSWCNFLTLFYITFVVLHTVPVLYNKYEDKVDPLAEKASIELKRKYAIFHAKVLSKIPIVALKAKKV